MAKRAQQAQAGTTLEIVRIQESSRVARADRFYSVLRTLIKTAGWTVTVLGVFHYLFLMVDAGAGRDTNINVVLRGFVKFGADRWIAYLVAALASGAYYHRRRVHLRDVEAKSRDIRRLEALVDPNRTGSGLTLREEVPPRADKH